jgi:hypothetical protein
VISTIDHKKFASNHIRTFDEPNRGLRHVWPAASFGERIIRP